MKVVKNLIFLLTLLGCASSTPTVKTQPQQPKVAQPDDSNIKQRFKKAYAEIACLANPGVDPDMTVLPLKNPEEFLKTAKKTSPERYSLAKEVLKKYGFFTVNDFLDTMKNLKLDAQYWNSVEDSFLDDLRKCK